MPSSKNPLDAPYCICPFDGHQCPHCGYYLDTLSARRSLEHRDGCHHFARCGVEHPSPVGIVDAPYHAADWPVSICPDDSLIGTITR